MRRCVGIAAAVCALALPGTALAGDQVGGRGTGGGCDPKTCVPKGTPYAVEVKLRMDFTARADVAFSYQTSDECSGDTRDVGETENTTVASNVTFPHITLPIATKQDLGAAYRRLHVKPTATATGTGAVTDGHFNATSDGPWGENCTEVRYETDNDLNSSSTKGFFTQASNGKEDVLILDTPAASGEGFSADPPQEAQFPPIYDGRLTGDPVKDALTSFVFVPEDNAPDPTIGESGITLQDHPAFFKQKLLHHSEFTYEPGFTSGGSPNPCEVDPDTCVVDFDYDPKLDFTRLHVYKTERDYPR
jgi:hypothetical protein